MKHGNGTGALNTGSKRDSGAGRLCAVRRWSSVWQLRARAFSPF